MKQLISGALGGLLFAAPIITYMWLTNPEAFPIIARAALLAACNFAPVIGAAVIGIIILARTEAKDH